MAQVGYHQFNILTRKRASHETTGSKCRSMLKHSFNQFFKNNTLSNESLTLSFLVTPPLLWGRNLSSRCGLGLRLALNTLDLRVPPASPVVIIIVISATAASENAAVTWTGITMATDSSPQTHYYVDYIPLDVSSPCCLCGRFYWSKKVCTDVYIPYIVYKYPCEPHQQIYPALTAKVIDYPPLMYLVFRSHSIQNLTFRSKTPLPRAPVTAANAIVDAVPELKASLGEPRPAVRVFLSKEVSLTS